MFRSILTRLRQRWWRLQSCLFPSASLPLPDFDGVVVPADVLRTPWHAEGGRPGTFPARIIGLSCLVDVVLDPATIQGAGDLLGRLESDDYIAYMQSYMQQGMERLGRHCFGLPLRRPSIPHLETLWQVHGLCPRHRDPGQQPTVSWCGLREASTTQLHGAMCATKRLVKSIP